MHLLFDIGGTKTRIALSKKRGAFDKVEIFNTPAKFKDGLKLFRDYVKKYRVSNVRAAAGGIRGRLNKDKTRTSDSMILKDWSGKPLAKELNKILKAKIILENDAHLAGLGEAVYGAGGKYKIVGYYTASSGIGGARIVNGTIDASRYGFEPGKQVVDLRAKKGLQTLEEKISGSSVEKRYGKHPKDLGQKFWDEAGGILAVGLYNSYLHWSPEVFVVGGSLMNDIKIPLVIKRFKALTNGKQSYQLPKIKKAELKDLGGLYGALALCGQK